MPSALRNLDSIWQAEGLVTCANIGTPALWIVMEMRRNIWECHGNVCKIEKFLEIFENFREMSWKHHGNA